MNYFLDPSSIHISECYCKGCDLRLRGLQLPREREPWRVVVCNSQFSQHNLWQYYKFDKNVKGRLPEGHPRQSCWKHLQRLRGEAGLTMDRGHWSSTGKGPLEVSCRSDGSPIRIRHGEEWEIWMYSRVVCARNDSLVL